MPQTLYRFGVDPENPTARAITPAPIVTNAEISIAWSSWCDFIYMTVNRNLANSISYLGTSLNATQQHEFSSPPRTVDASNMRQPLLDTREPLRFFGTAMQDGVRGYVTNSKITIFGTPAEIAGEGDAYRDVDSWEIPHTLQHSIAQVCMCSDNSLLIACKSKPTPEPASGAFELKKDGNYSYPEVDKAGLRSQTICRVANFQQLRESCFTETTPELLAEFAPTQLVVNATTATALDQHGKVHTHTADPRYPACLGRPYTGTSTFQPVPYLSETRITKIASGGYVTAVISEEGELFLWGQANPGSEGDLGVLGGRHYEAVSAMENTVIWRDDEQDDNVKCLNIYIGGSEATAYDIAVGFGHILVAAKNDAGQRVVFAAGCGDQGQLGIGRAYDFLEEFEEVVALRGKQVAQMAAAGWSSFVVVEER